MRANVAIGGMLMAACALAQAAATEALVQGVPHDALFAINFDGARGVAAGAPGKLLDSSDGGKTWTQDKTFPTPLAVLGADIKGEHVVVVGQMGMIFTRDGKGEWKKARAFVNAIAGPGAGDGDVVPLVRVQPEYPPAAAKDGIEGSVKMELTVGADGSVRNAKVVSATPPGVFDEGATAAALKWKFKPKLVNGKPVEQQTVQELAFKLEGTTERLMNVSLNSKGLAVAVGAFGTVIKSGDFGGTWTAIAPDWKPYLTADQIEQGIQPHMSAVHVGEDGVITIAGEFSLILRSSDGGATWTAVNKGEATIFSLDLRADGVGYAVGQDGVVLRSTDGGASWTKLEPATKANLLGVRSDGATVIVSAMHDMIVSTDDGKTWRHIHAPDVQAAWYSGVAIANGVILAVGHSGRVVKLNL